MSCPRIIVLLAFSVSVLFLACESANQLEQETSAPQVQEPSSDANSVEVIFPPTPDQFINVE